MEEGGTNKGGIHTFRAICYEMFGTFVLIYSINLTTNLPTNVQTITPHVTKDPFAMGIVLFLLLQLGWNISGAHFNPATRRIMTKLIK